MKIKICISTCKNYNQKTIPVLINSLKACNFPTEDILVVDGGYDEEASLLVDGIKTIQVNHNSFDFTSLIAVTEKNIESDFWLLLHDTCRVGVNFYNLLNKIDLSYKKIALKYFPSMSIGLYQYDYLLQHKEIIAKTKNIDYSKEGLSIAKQKATNSEDLLLWKLNDTPCGIIGQQAAQFQPVDNGWYETATNRIQEYFSQLDLYKLKANWGQHSNPSELIHII